MDNLEFTKFVLGKEEMSDEQKAGFLEAVPKMTDGEKALYASTLVLEEGLGRLEEVMAVETDAAVVEEDVDAAVQEYLTAQSEASDEARIEEIRDNLKAAE